MKNAVKSGFLAICTAALIGGCVPAPRQGDGRISLSVSWGDKRFASRAPRDIAAVVATLTRQELVLTVNMTVDQAACTASGSAENLYAGKWTVKVDAAMADGTVIYTGKTQVMVAAGETREVAMSLEPAPGRLAITLDVSPLLAAGKEVTEGKVYIYDADSTAATETMTLDGAILSGVVDLPPMTYEARVCIPQSTNAIFESEYFSFDIQSGRTTTVSLVANGALSVNITIAAEPDRVEGLAVTTDGTTATLTWGQAARATGYRVYRTDGDGRFIERAVVEGGSATSYIDTTFGTAKPYDSKVRYAVAALAGEIEGLRSDPVEVPKI